MGRISRKARPAAAPAATGDGFDELREAFQARLKGDRLHFVVLSAALARTDENPTRIFDDLQYRAHRLRGSAAIFDVAEVAAAAEALEQAAAGAVAAQADNTDTAVRSALVALVRLMGHSNSPRPPTLADRAR